MPDLGLPAIRAKIDTGAKTSALHAFEIETFGPLAAPMVRFGVHPVPGREDIARYCAAAVADRRDVTSSNGDREARYVIQTRLMLGQRDWGEIEMTLANRESMAYRMLLGRQAIRGGVLVDPAASFLQPRLSHKLYERLPEQHRPPRQLRIALIASKPDRTSNQLLRAEAQKRGHDLEILPLDRLQIDFSGRKARLLVAGAPATHFDAVIARAAGGPPGLVPAVVRLMQRAGTVALNDADAIERLRNPFVVADLLNSSGLPPPQPTGDQQPPRALVLLGVTVATHGAIGAAQKRLAAKAAAALGLGFTAVAFARGDGEARIAGFDHHPSLTAFKQGAKLAQLIISAVETRVRAPLRAPVADAES